MASLSDLFGRGTVAEQLLVWGVLNELIGTVLGPSLAEITQDVNSNTPLVALSPDIAANLVVRGFITMDAGANIAGQAGISADKFAQLVDVTGDAPSPTQLIEGLRRQLIPFDSDDPTTPSFTGGIQQGLLKNQWIPLMQALGIEVPSQADALAAYLRGQIDEATSQQRFAEAGGDPTWFQTAYTTSGESPSAVEAGVLANRGIIPWDGTGPDAVTFQQAILEGSYRNKWTAAYQALAVYLPPPRTITAMLKEGALTQAQALLLLQQHGLSPTLAAAYVTGASSTTTVAVKALTESQIVSLYEDKLIDETQAISALVAAKYTTQDAQYLLQLADLKAAAAATKSAVGRIQALYQARKIDATTATNDLTALGLPQSQVTELLAVWDLETTATVRTLSAAQLAEAVGYGVIDQATGQLAIEALGYTPLDAWILMSNSNKGPLPNMPAGPAI